MVPPVCEIDVFFFFFFQAEDGIRDLTVTGVQTCALPISRLGAEVALVQAHAPAVAQIDCGYEQHHPNRRKFASNLAPVAAERSGWNCVPQKFLCRTIADRGSP